MGVSDTGGLQNVGQREVQPAEAPVRFDRPVKIAPRFQAHYAPACSCSGMMPICCIRPSRSSTAHTSTILPSFKRWMWTPVTSTSLPVGTTCGMPSSTPVCLPRPPAGDHLVPLSNLLDDLYLRFSDHADISQDGSLLGLGVSGLQGVVSVLPDAIGRIDLVRNIEIPLRLELFVVSSDDGLVLFQRHGCAPPSLVGSFLLLVIRYVSGHALSGHSEFPPSSASLWGPRPACSTLATIGIRLP
jgi:hypothetical protein